MPNLYLNLENEVSPDSNTANMIEYMSVGEALRLVAPFKGEIGCIGVFRKFRQRLK
jgi:hypothetical protein